MGLFKILTIAICCCAFTAPEAQARDVTLNGDGTLLFTANSDARSISVLSTATLMKQAEIPLEFEPESLSLDSQDRIWVTLRRDDRVGVFNSGMGGRTINSQIRSLLIVEI